MEVVYLKEGDRILSRVITDDTLAGLAQLVEGYSSVYLVCDSGVAGTVGEKVSSILGMSDLFSSRFCGQMLLDTSEEAKTMDTVLAVCRWLFAGGADRSSLLLAAGGGITTDIAGFAASIYMRGISFAYVPTTLLGQVDAAIGGKNGVNLDSYKNMIGVIRQPDFTYICPEVLETLPRREFLSGAAELLKTFLIEDGGNYCRAVRVLAEYAAGNDTSAFMNQCGREFRLLLSAAAGVKAGVVERDMFESGERRKLNLGHTFAHAIEHEARKTGMDITHGEAVAMGIVQAAGLSVRLGIGVSDLQERIVSDFRCCGLPVDCPFTYDALADAMARDKKSEGGQVNMVLIRNVGDVVTRKMDVRSLEWPDGKEE